MIAPSEHVRSELAELFGLPTERVVAIAPGVDPSFAAAGDPAPLLRRLGLERPYVLAVGTDSPRKNLGLLDAIAPKLEADGLAVVIAGSSRAVHAHDLGRRRGAPPRLRAGPDLPELYTGAAAFAMPSLYEGFGLPCVEAMAAGTPVVAADRGALPEACGGAALLADPADPDAFAAALLSAAGPRAGAARDRGPRARGRAHLAAHRRGGRPRPRAAPGYWQTPVTVFVQPW